MNASSPNHTLSAAITMVCAMAIIGVIDNFIARLAVEIGLWQFHFVRALIALPLVLSLSLVGLGSFRPRRVWAMWQAAPWVGVLVNGSVTGVFLIIRAYQLADPSYVSVSEYSVMIFGPLFAWVAFGQPVTGWQIVGIALIAAAGGIIALRSR